MATVNKLLPIPPIFPSPFHDTATSPLLPLSHPSNGGTSGRDFCCKFLKSRDCHVELIDIKPTKYASFLSQKLSHFAIFNAKFPLESLSPNDRAHYIRRTFKEKDFLLIWYPLIRISRGIYDYNFTFSRNFARNLLKFCQTEEILLQLSHPSMWWSKW